MNKILVLVIAFFFSLNVQAQYDHEGVFPAETGEDLKEMVIESYKPLTVLSYGQARDTMYGIIYNVNDSIAGIYSDHKVYLQPGVDPTQGVFMDGQPDGINAEHSYPQSKGAGDGNPRSDMHHLFPSRVAVNSARGSLPFGEINDSFTDSWYYKTIETTTDPSLNIRDNYSERTQSFWEPREEAKGNIARAIFYFYTMYQDEADGSDPDFFNIQKDDLCDWHFADPVDQLEWERTFMIADWQDDKPNPFVLDCSLASRIYCPMISQACQVLNVDEMELNDFALIGNPFQDELVIEGAFAQNQIREISVFSMLGAEVIHNEYTIQNNEIVISANQLLPGSYYIRISYEKNNILVTQVIKAIKTQ
jgi:hypothetical protein